MEPPRRRVSGRPLVSVIIPAYNAESYIREALESALGQTYEPLEIIVVDDGSRDRTAEIVREVAVRDQRVTLLQQPNAGVAAARNLAIEHARGAYVAPLDADDYWLPKKIEEQVRRLEEGGPGMGAVYSWWVEVDESGAIRGSNYPFRVEGYVYWHHLYSNFIGCASIPLIRRSVLMELGGYDTSLRTAGGEGCEDWDITLRIAARYAIGLAPGYLAVYRNVANSMSTDCRSMETSYNLVVERARRVHPEVPEAVFRWSRGVFNGYLAAVSYANRKYATALRLIVGAAWADPAVLLSRSTLRMGVRSQVGLVARPLMEKFWPTRHDWTHFKRRIGTDRSRIYTLDEIESEWEQADGAATPWKNSRKPYSIIVERRWRWITEETRKGARIAGGAAPRPKQV